MLIICEVCSHVTFYRRWFYVTSIVNDKRCKPEFDRQDLMLYSVMYKIFGSFTDQSLGA